MIKYKLRNIKALCKVLGQPQKNFDSIHIVGTNGKGSTAFYLSNILQAHKLKVGLFTSPHLVSVRERFRINGEMISQRKLNSLLRRIDDAAKVAKIQPSYFETLTAAAFLWFKESKVQVAVLEAGLGGRLDCTKIAGGKIAAITSIGLDHTDLLGNTEEEILKEKLGILKKGAILILGNLPRNLILECPPHIKAKKIKPELKVGNPGKIYIQNAELAYAIASTQLSILNYQLSTKKARSALKKSVWPGRMQIISKKFILDGAHNPAAAKALAKCLKEKKIPPLPCVFASLTDKDTIGVLKALKPHISICNPVQIENSKSVKEIEEICKKLKIKTAPFRKNKNLVLVTGSLYLVGKILTQM